MIDLDAMPAADAEFARRYVLPCSYGSVSDTSMVSASLRRSREPNELERDFGLCVTCWHVYEAITFHHAGGISYRPDWVIHTSKSLALVEVKLDTSKMTKQAKSRLATQNRESLLKLKLCAVNYPSLEWYLAKRRDGVWRLYPVTSRGIARKAVQVEWLKSE